MPKGTYTRRRRAVAAPVEIATPEPVAASDQVADAQPEPDEQPGRRRRRASVGGMHLKLSFKERPGYVRRWFNDEPGRIANAEDLAYTHVEDRSIKSDGTDSRVRRYVGKDDNGQPLYAYLMETPEREYAYGQTEKAEAIRRNEEAICEGRSEQGGIDSRYGKVSIRA